MIEITPEMKTTYIETAKVLKGDERRIFMGRIVKTLGKGGQAYAEREFGWNRLSCGLLAASAPGVPTGHDPAVASGQRAGKS